MNKRIVQLTTAINNRNLAKASTLAYELVDLLATQGPEVSLNAGNLSALFESIGALGQPNS